MFAFKFNVILLCCFLSLEELEALKCWNCTDEKCENPKEQNCEGQGWHCLSQYDDKPNQYLVIKGCRSPNHKCSDPGENCQTCETDLCNDYKHELVDFIKCYDCDEGPCKDPQIIKCSREDYVCVTQDVGKELEGLKCWNCTDEKCENPKEQDCGEPKEDRWYCTSYYSTLNDEIVVKKGCIPSKKRCVTPSESCHSCDSDLCNDYQHDISVDFIKCYHCEGYCKKRVINKCLRRLYVCVSQDLGKGYQTKTCANRSSPCIVKGNKKAANCEYCDEDLCNRGNGFVHNIFLFVISVTFVLFSIM